MSAPNEDHRQKNILLAKNLNKVKMDLRDKKKDLCELRSQLRTEKQRNSKLESDQATILNRIDFLKEQLDETFYKNTVGYVHLSKQLDQMHHDSAQSFNTTMETNGDLNATFSASNQVTQSTFLDKIKAINESMVSNSNSGDIEVTTGPSTLNCSSLSAGRQSLSFGTFSMGLSSTLVNETKEDDNEEMNCTFLDDSENTAPLSEVTENRLNITLRRSKKQPRYENASKMAKKIVRNQLVSDTENQPMATDLVNTSASDVRMLRSGSRPVKKIDYNESIRRKK